MYRNIFVKVSVYVINSKDIEHIQIHKYIQNIEQINIAFTLSFIDLDFPI